MPRSAPKKTPRIPKAFEAIEAQHLALNGGALIAGIDEAGRGPLAGPVAVGLTIFDPALFLAPAPEDYKDHEKPVEPGTFRSPSELSALDDSKKLKEPVREELLEAIRSRALFATGVQISSKLVDGMGIVGALEFGMLRALARADQAGLRVRTVLIDGSYRLERLMAARPQHHWECVVKGDSRVFSIAAASILAKVSRDRRMLRYEKLFPGYEMGRHKGYGTAAHRAKIRELGPCPIHRRSYRW